MVNNSLSVLHGYEDVKHQRFWGHDFDLLGHWTGRGYFFIGGQWWPCVYLTQVT